MSDEARASIAKEVEALTTLIHSEGGKAILARMQQHRAGFLKPASPAGAKPPVGRPDDEWESF